MRRVPDTNTFSLQDVLAITGGTSLQDAFNNAIDYAFDPTYGHLAGNKIGSLSMFRNYTLMSKGDSFAGGIVIQEYAPDRTQIPSGQKLLISAPYDVTNSAPWDLGVNRHIGTCLSQWPTGVFLGDSKVDPYVNSLIGTGMIVDATGPGYYAAKLCQDYVYGGYEDWCLPDIYELLDLRQYINMSIDYGWTGTAPTYWSSSEDWRNTGNIFVDEATWDQANALTFINPPDETTWGVLKRSYMKNRRTQYGVRAVRHSVSGYFANFYTPSSGVFN